VEEKMEWKKVEGEVKGKGKEGKVSKGIDYERSMERNRNKRLRGRVGRVRWSRVGWSRVRWSRVGWSRVRWSRIGWSRVRWSRVGWSRVRWSMIT
jgi:hypothetical protein